MIVSVPLLLNAKLALACVYAQSDYSFDLWKILARSLQVIKVGKSLRISLVWYLANRTILHKISVFLLGTNG